MSKIVSTDKARQGHWGRHVLVVLVAALLLAAMAWGIAEIYGVAIEPSHRRNRRRIELPRASGSASMCRRSADAAGLAGTSTFSAFLWISIVVSR